jgi:hypothetical protein
VLPPAVLMLMGRAGVQAPRLVSIGSYLRDTGCLRDRDGKKSPGIGSLSLRRTVTFTFSDLLKTRFQISIFTHFNYHCTMLYDDLSHTN